MSTISDGTTTITPAATRGFSSGRPSRNRLIEPIDSPEPYVSLAEAGTRAGRFEYLFHTAADSLACEDLHIHAAVLTFTSSTDGTSLTYVLADSSSAVVRERRTDSPYWTVLVDYREVSP